MIACIESILPSAYPAVVPESLSWREAFSLFFCLRAKHGLWQLTRKPWGSSASLPFRRNICYRNGYRCLFRYFAGDQIRDPLLWAFRLWGNQSFAVFPLLVGIVAKGY